MAINPHFYLKNPNEDETLIYLGMKLKDGTLFKYSTGQKVIPDLFDKASKRAIVSGKELKDYKKLIPNIQIKQKNLNTHLSNMENDTRRVMDELIRDVKAIKKADLKAKLDAIYNPKAPKKFNKYFSKHLEEFIQKCESGEKLHKGRKYGKATLKTYKTFKNLMAEYNSRLTFEDVNMDFYKSFINFLNQKNYKLNFVGKNIKFIKVIMKDAFEAGLHQNLSYTFKHFEVPSEKSVEVYLSQDELERMYALDLKKKPNYELARDVFLCGCYTALRYSDYSRISKNHIKENKGKYSLDMITVKTKERVIIPLKPLVVNILKKYDFSLPKTWEQKVNKYIKEVCKMAKIDEPVEIIATVGGKRETYYSPKYELVKTHTARRTGATLLYLAGVPAIDIQKITAHTTISNLLKYIRVSKEETANRLAENPFFK